MQFATLPRRLIKLAVRVEVLKTKLRLHLPKTAPGPVRDLIAAGKVRYFAL
jgi:hypothetical protein